MLRFPEITLQNISADTVELQFQVTADVQWFVGHFPQKPVLPGVVQIDWAIHFARLYFNIPRGFQRMEKVKFQDLIIPGQSLMLALTKKSASRFAFRYSNKEKTFSSGIIDLSLTE